MKDIYNSFSKSTVSISYLGKTDDEITGRLIQLAESYLQNMEGLNYLSRRVPFLIAESFQNVVRHGSQPNNQLNRSLETDLFQIYILHDRVILCAANQIKNKNVAALDARINNLNSLDKEELKELWKHTITKDDFSDKGGAGLGLIEMARKSRMPIIKKFVKLNEKTSLFFLGIEILKKDTTHESTFNLSQTEKLYNNFVKDGVILQYNGHFSEETNAPLIEIIQSNLIRQGAMSTNATENLSVISWLMKKSSKHGVIINELREGIFSIRKIHDELFIYCGNFINYESHREFKQQLERLKSMSLEALEQEQNLRRKEIELSGNGDVDIGFLGIAISTKNTFEFSFKKMANNLYFYSIEIKLKDIR
jgi:hypothetical protein